MCSKRQNGITCEYLMQHFEDYDKLYILNVIDVLNEIPIHIYKHLIRGAYDRSEQYVKRPSTRKRKPKKYLD